VTEKIKPLVSSRLADVASPDAARRAVWAHRNVAPVNCDWRRVAFQPWFLLQLKSYSIKRLMFSGMSFIENDFCFASSWMNATRSPSSTAVSSTC
jgi:hypothetical protein